MPPTTFYRRFTGKSTRVTSQGARTNEPSRWLQHLAPVPKIRSHLARRAWFARARGIVVGLRRVERWQGGPKGLQLPSLDDIQVRAEMEGECSLSERVEGRAEVAFLLDKGFIFGGDEFHRIFVSPSDLT